MANDVLKESGRRKDTEEKRRRIQLGWSAAERARRETRAFQRQRVLYRLLTTPVR